MGQAVTFSEVISPDHERVPKSCGELSGWQVTVGPAMGGHHLDGTGTGASEGAVGPGDRGGVKIYMRVGDLDACLGRAEQPGGKLLVPLAGLRADFGRFAAFTGLDGNQAGLWA